MTLYLGDRLSTALHIDNKEWLTLLVSIYRGVYTPPRGSVLHHSKYASELSRFTPWNEAKRFQYVTPTFVKAMQS